MNERTVDAAAVDASQATNGAGGPPRRRRWVALLGLFGLVAGAVAGWTARDPLYRAEALVYISPSMPSPQDPKGEHILPIFHGFVSYQVALLESQRVAHGATESEAWQKTGRRTSPELLASFVERRSIVHEPKTQHIRVRFANEQPDVALAGVRALMEAYQKLSAEQDRSDELLSHATMQAEVLEATLRETTDPVQRQAVAEKRDKAKQMKEELKAQLVGKGRISIADRGSLPVSPSEDRRPLFATLGGVLVCLLGTGIGLGVGGARPIAKGEVT